MPLLDVLASQFGSINPGLLVLFLGLACAWLLYYLLLLYLIDDHSRMVIAPQVEHFGKRGDRVIVIADTNLTF